MNKLQIQKIVHEVMHEEPDAKNIKKVSLFGSYLHENARDDSDVDLLFEMKKTMSLLQIGGLQYRLQQHIGKKVDFVERDSLNRYIKDAVIAEAEPIYEQS